jgi:hypothetical protein
VLCDAAVHHFPVACARDLHEELVFAQLTAIAAGNALPRAANFTSRVLKRDTVDKTLNHNLEGMYRVF